jgi:hypothetical protein
MQAQTVLSLPYRLQDILCALLETPQFSGGTINPAAIMNSREEAWAILTEHVIIPNLIKEGRFA